MSSYYYIANKSNKTLFNLGKWYLWSLMDEPEACFDLEYLQLFIENDCFGEYLNTWETKDKTDEELENFKIHMKSFAPKIHSFVQGSTVKDLLFFNDSGDELYVAECLGYKLADSVYGQEDVDDFNESLETDKERYNPEFAKDFHHIYHLFVDEKEETK